MLTRSNQVFFSRLSVGFAWAVSSFIAASQVTWAGVYDGLTPEQKSKIQAGQQVVVTQDAAGSAWPKVWVYQRIESTPEEAAAVFTDFESAPSYIPNLKKAKISKRIAKNIFEIDYILEVPVFADEEYTVRDVVTSYDRGASYQIEWSLVRASSTKSSNGYAKFEALGSGTIMAYYNFVVPGAFGSGMVKERAMRQVRDTVNLTVKQVEKQRTSNRAGLDRQIQVLRQMLD
jgi:hypothetical protein